MSIRCDCCAEEIKAETCHQCEECGYIVCGNCLSSAIWHTCIAKSFIFRKKIVSDLFDSDKEYTGEDEL